MVDIHSHILYGLDDGSQSLEQSLEMVRVAIDSGTREIVASPHADGQYSYDPEVVEARRQELQHLAGPEIIIHRGCDFHLSYDNIQQALDSPATYSINGLGYLLVEFSNADVPAAIDQVFAAMLRIGLLPIITHPERNRLLAPDVNRLAAWVGEGCYLQITAQSLLGGFGSDARKSALTLLDRGLAHFIASDAHDPTRRPPRLDLAHQFVTDRLGKAHAELLLQSNPKSVVDGARLPVGPVPMAGRSKSWFKMWK